MISYEELLHMRKMNFQDINENEIPDIHEINVDKSKSKEKRLMERLESGVNPYFVKCGKVIVKIGYTVTSQTIEDILEHLLSAEHEAGSGQMKNCMLRYEQD